MYASSHFAAAMVDRGMFERAKWLFACTPDDVATKIVESLSNDRPHSRVLIVRGFMRIVYFVVNNAPTNFGDLIMRAM